MIKKLKILILGGTGLLGSHCQRYFSQNYEVAWTYFKSLNEDKNGILFSYSGKDSVLLDVIKKSKPDIIINTIGLVSVDACELNHNYASLLNTKLVKEIVDVIKILNLDNCYFVQISSGGVYGDRKNRKEYPWNENDELNPLSVYAKSKYKGEIEAQKNIGPTLIIRSDFYGLNFITHRETLLSWIIYHAENDLEMDGWENVFFSPISASYLSKTIEQAIIGRLEGIYNIGSTDGCNKYDFVEKVCKKIKLSPKIRKINTDKRTRLIRPRYSVLSCEKLSKVVDFSYNWEDGLTDYLNTHYLR